MGYNVVKSTPNSGVYFYVQKNATFSSVLSVIPYEVERLNSGGAMNLATGVFTAPLRGRYHFTFTALSGTADETGNFVFVRVNGAHIGISYAYGAHNSIPIVATVNLEKGDTVDSFLHSGSILDTSEHHRTQFSGILLEEDVDLQI